MPMDSAGDGRIRPTERAAVTRRLILDAAREMLVGDGYGRFGLDAVAGRAGITRMTVYNHFGSRQGLLEAIADDLTQRGEGVERDIEALGRSTASEALRALVTAACRFWGTDPALFRRFVGLSAIDPQALDVFESRDRVRRESVGTVMGRFGRRVLFNDDRIGITACRPHAFGPLSSQCRTCRRPAVPMIWKPHRPGRVAHSSAQRPRLSLL